jgi:hypothetical protein
VTPPVACGLLQLASLAAEARCISFAAAARSAPALPSLSRPARGAATRARAPAARTSCNTPSGDGKGEGSGRGRRSGGGAAQAAGQRCSSGPAGAAAAPAPSRPAPGRPGGHHRQLQRVEQSPPSTHLCPPAPPSSPRNRSAQGRAWRPGSGGDHVRSSGGGAGGAGAGQARRGRGAGRGARRAPLARACSPPPAPLRAAGAAAPRPLWPRPRTAAYRARCTAAQFDGFKACFGGEELKRACATLSGALVNHKAKVRRWQGGLRPRVHGLGAAAPGAPARRQRQPRRLPWQPASRPRALADRALTQPRLSPAHAVAAAGAV